MYQEVVRVQTKLVDECGSARAILTALKALLVSGQDFASAPGDVM